MAKKISELQPVSNVKTGDLFDISAIQDDLSYVSNKVEWSNVLSTIVSNVSGNFLLLDTSNGPLTGDLEITTVDPEIRLTDSGNSEYTRVTKSDTSNLAARYNRVLKAPATGSVDYSTTGSPIVSTDGEYTVLTYTSSGTFVVNSGTGTADILIIGGGGGGGGAQGDQPGGGGGAGGFVLKSAESISAQTYTVTVGNGGTGGPNLGDATQGGDSVFGAYTAVGGGYGGRGGSSSTDNDAGDGGSGGGAGGMSGSSIQTDPGSGTVDQGHNGGQGYRNSTPSLRAGGGGGGATSVGGNASSGTGGSGGVGTANSITGSSVTYAGGGGGGNGGGAGSGGGGAGGNGGNGQDGTDGLGGGGGAGDVQSDGGDGGDGVVIVRFLSANATTVEVPIWQAVDGDNPLSEGKLTFGYEGSLSGRGSHNVIDGQSLDFNINGTTYASQDNSGDFVFLDDTGIELGSGSDVTHKFDGTGYLIGGISSATVATDDKVIIQDTNASDYIKTVTAQSIADLAPAQLTFGTDNQIPYVNAGGDDFDYSSDFTFDGSDLVMKKQAMLGGTTVTYTAGSLSDNLVSHWLMNDDAANTTVADNYGSNNGTFVGGNTEDKTITGKINAALDFDGNDYVSINYHSSADVGTGDFAASFWVKTTDSGSNKIALCCFESGVTTAYWGIQPVSSSGIRFFAKDTRLQQSWQSGTTVGDGAWHHVVINVDRDSAVTGYVDNSLVSWTTTGSISQIDGDIDGGHKKHIAALYAGNQELNGSLDDIRLYKGRILSTNDRAALYNSGNGTESEGGVEAHFQTIATSESYTSSHELDSLQDLAIEGELEVNSNAYIDGNIHQLSDNVKHYFGAADDASITYDGTDLCINTAEVGSGTIKINGTSAVANGTYTMGLGTATNGTITIKDGIITAVQECADA